MTPQETDPDLPVSVQGVSSRGVGQQWSTAESGTLSKTVREKVLLKEVAFTASTPTTGSMLFGTQPCPLIENCIKDLLSIALPIRTKPDTPTASLSHQEASTSLLFLSIRGQTE